MELKMRGLSRVLRRERTRLWKMKTVMKIVTSDSST